MAPVTEGPKIVQTDQGGVKDFSNRYLKEGMWPGKIQSSFSTHNQSNVHDYYHRQSMDAQSFNAAAVVVVGGGVRQSVNPKVQVLNEETRIKAYQPGNMTERGGGH